MAALHTPSHLERTALEPRGDQLLSVTISHVDQVNKNIRVITLDLNDGPVHFKPGQWLDTYVPSASKAGGFTITSTPRCASSEVDRPFLELAVQESPQNPAAEYLWRGASEIVGSILEVRIGGSFTLDLDTAWNITDTTRVEGIKRVVFIAGGVGVNPIVSMLGAIAEAARHDVRVDVVYSSKLPDDGISRVLFLQRVTRWFRQGMLKGTMKLFLTNDDLLEGEDVAKMDNVEVISGRRIESEELLELVRAGGRHNTIVYICGPPMMTDCYVALLTDSQVCDPERIRYEKWW